MVSSLNQVRQFYALNNLKKDSEELTSMGDYKIKVVGSNSGAIQKQIYFLVKGYDTVLKSDYIPIQNITYAKGIAADDMATYMKKVYVALDENVNDGAPVVGQDYILRINLRQFYGMGDQDQYFKDAAVHVTKGMDAEAFYTAMAKALNLCFSREVGATTTSNPYLTFSADSESIIIEEKPQPFEVGVEAVERVYFDVVPTTIYCDGADTIWGTATEETGKSRLTKVGNLRQLIDLEYFLLGERGDQYRKIGWPNDIETKGVLGSNFGMYAAYVGKDKDITASGYPVFELHYTFSDTGVNSYNTEKDITLAFVQDASDNGINAFITAFNTATGLSIPAVDEAAGIADTSEGKAVVDEATATSDTESAKAAVDNVVVDNTTTDNVATGTAEAVVTPEATGETATAETVETAEAVGETVTVEETSEQKPVVDNTEEATTEATTAEATETITA